MYMEQKYYDELIEGLQQAASYVKGDTSKCARIDYVEKTDPIPQYTAEDVARTRKELNLTQWRLADALGVSPRTVEAWESGRNEPSGAAQHLLYLFDIDHSLVDKFISR